MRTTSLPSLLSITFVYPLCQGPALLFTVLNVLIAPAVGAGDDAAVSRPNLSIGREYVVHSIREEPAAEELARPWHVDLGSRISYVKLQETDQTLDRKLDLPLRLDVFGVFDHPTTPLDRKTDFALNSIFLGLGRMESDRFVWSIYGGAAAGSDKSSQRFLTTELDVRFRYGFYYLGAQLEFYPWRIPDPVPQTAGFSERLRAGRPFVLTGFETAFVNGTGAGDYRVLGLSMYADSAHIRDWLFSVPLGVGWSIPLSDRCSLQLMGDYRFHFYRPQEFNGWHLMTALRLRL